MKLKTQFSVPVQTSEEEKPKKKKKKNVRKTDADI